MTLFFGPFVRSSHLSLHSQLMNIDGARSNAGGAVGIQIKSRNRRSPRQIVLAPGAPSLLRPKNPPNSAIHRMVNTLSAIWSNLPPARRQQLLLILTQMINAQNSQEGHDEPLR
jgi:hypothetical protein